jgi:DNA-binding Lrp family transcriptional regulator
MGRFESERRLVDGYVLIQASSGDRVPKLAEALSHTPGVVEAERVNGPYDLIARVREMSDDARLQQAVRAIGEIDGVLRAIPLLIASSASSKSDPEAA